MAKSKKVKLQSVPLPTPSSPGTQVVIPNDSAVQITEAEQRVLQLQLHLGQRAEEFEQYKAQLLSAIADARKTYTDTVLSVGKQLQLNIGEDTTERWEFQRDKMMFVRLE